MLKEWNLKNKESNQTSKTDIFKTELNENEFDQIKPNLLVKLLKNDAKDAQKSHSQISKDIFVKPRLHKKRYLFGK